VFCRIPSEAVGDGPGGTHDTEEHWLDWALSRDGLPARDQIFGAQWHPPGDVDTHLSGAAEHPAALPGAPNQRIQKPDEMAPDALDLF